MNREDPVVDIGVLDELVTAVGNDPAFVADLARTFIGDATELVATIQAATATADLDSLTRAAHTLKSSSATLGCLRLAATARSVEMEAREGRIASAAQDGTLESAWADASAGMTAWIGRQPT